MDRHPVCIISISLNGLISKPIICILWRPFKIWLLCNLIVNRKISKVTVTLVEGAIKQLLYGKCWVFLQVEILLFESFLEIFNHLNFFLVILKRDHLLLLLNNVLTPIVVALIFRNIYLLKFSS